MLGGPAGVCNVFFTRCNLQCRYCQNHQISRNHGPILARDMTLEQVVAAIERVWADGVTPFSPNGSPDDPEAPRPALGFVSPSHVMPRVRAVVEALWARGRRPVVILNTNAYDRVDVVRAMADMADIWLPDLKYLDPALAHGYSGAADYPEIATAAIREMYAQKGAGLRLDDHGAAESGLIVRHLVLPGHAEESIAVLRWIADELSPSVHLSLMSQYAPTPAVADHPRLGRRVTADEYHRVVAEMERLGFYRGWVQELDSAACYAPDFRQTHPFEGEAPGTR